MRRFNYDDNDKNNDDHHKEVDRFFADGDEFDDFDEEIANLSPEKYKALVEEEEQALFDLQFNLAIQEHNHKLLRTAARIAENSFWWKFYSVNTRLHIINKIYKRIKKIEENNADI